MKEATCDTTQSYLVPELLTTFAGVERYGIINNYSRPGVWRL